MIPTPPIQAVIWRHIAIERDRSPTLAIAVAPVVEKPDIDSNRASSGFESCGSPSTYGSAPKTAISSHTSETTPRRRVHAANRPQRTSPRHARPTASAAAGKQKNATRLA